MVAQLKTLPQLILDRDPVGAVLLEDERRLAVEARKLVQFVARGNASLEEQLRPILNLSGKRIRPLLPFWMLRVVDQNLGGAVSGERAEAIVRVGAVTLALHSAAIAIDDIEDGSLERQAQTALHLRRGLGPTLNAASMLIFGALQYLADPALVDLALETITRCHRGQALDLAFADPRVAYKLFEAGDAERRARWMECARLKTSQLMELSIRLAGRVLAVPLPLVEHAAAAISGYGIAYQILDDVKNLRPDLMGAKAYEDLPHGLRSRVCIELMAGMSQAELAHVRSLYGGLAFTTFVLSHPGLPGAIRRSIDEADQQTAAAERALNEMAGDDLSRAYLRELLQRPIEDLGEQVDA